MAGTNPPRLSSRSFDLAGTQGNSASFAEAAGRGLASAAVLFDLIVDLLAVIQRREARAFDSGNVDENILTAIVGLYNPLGAVEGI